MNDENRFEQEFGLDEPEKVMEKNIQKRTPKKKKPGIWKVLIILALAILFGVIASITFFGTNIVIDRLMGIVSPGTKQEIGSQTGEPIGTTDIQTQSGIDIVSNVADVAEKVMPSVVSITSMSVQEVQTFPFGGVTRYEVPSSGSGIVIAQNEKEVLIVTNNHVVENSNTLTVVWIDGTSSEAVIKGTDAERDLAVIAVSLTKLESDTKKKIKVASLGDSTKLRVGESTIAIGNALGYGQSVTLGIVSALDRTLEGIEGTLIQTDAAINPGNSGGALLNANGQVIGINTAKVSASAVEGMGYAIPISDVEDILENLMNQKAKEVVPESQRGTIGIYGVDLGADVASWYSVPQGVYIQSLVKGGAAEKAKVPVGSILTKLEGKTVGNLADLNEELQYYKKGEKVTLTLYVQSGNQYVEKEYEITLK